MNEIELQKEYIKKLQENSEEFNMVIKATDWLNKEMKNGKFDINSEAIRLRNMYLGE